ncbi:MAG: acetyltransferase [Acetobacterales bacterium]
MSTKPLLIFGSAEMATLARFYFEQDGGRRVAAYTVDDDYVDAGTLDGLPLVPFSEATMRFPAVSHDGFVALSYNRLNRLRAAKAAQMRDAGYLLASYVCSRSVTWPDLVIGDNCFVLENQTIQPTVTIGNNVYLWSGNHIGHGTVIEDDVYVASHVVVSGHCRLGRGSFFGVNATVRDFCTIGAECFVTMGAPVTRDLPDGSVALAAGGEVLPPDDRRAAALRKKYFSIGAGE